MEPPVSTEDTAGDPPPPTSEGASGQSSVESSLPSPPLLTVISGLPPQSHPLQPGPVVVGRSSDADLQLKHPEISRRHCRLTWSGGTGCTIEDLGSRWGTKVNGAALPSESPVPLQPGDRLQIGPVLVHFGFGEMPNAESGFASGPGDHAPEAAAPSASASSGSGRGPQVLVQGREVEIIPLGQQLRLGRAGEVDVVLSDPSISRQHATIEHTSVGYQVTDLRSRAGSLVNGRRFEKHQLVIGDQLQMGPFFFRFDGQALERTTGLAGVEIEAYKLARRAGLIAILDNVSLKIDRGQFVAILGPSGSGKSSLLDTLTGLRPADSGVIRFDGIDFYQEYDRLRSLLGYVPQDDIVHRELTVSEALLFSARLRLPAGTPDIEIHKLVAQTINRLGLEGRTDTPIHRLSGGQRKRVSVGVELLGRPAILFLDEPTSGLDPASEFKMMELLRHLADGGCTVVCTTHVMENVYLTDKLFVIAGDKATGGKLVFSGGAQEARDHFGVQKLTMLYDRLAERPAAEWRELMHQTQGEPAPLTVNPGAEASPRSSLRVSRKPKPAAALPVLLDRQWTILRADWKNFLILFGQPMVIALLVAWVTDDTTLSLFFAYLATLWFGCSNAAQEIVKELPIYRRERMVGLGRHSYLISKFSLMGTLTAVQGIFLYACLWMARYILYPDPDPGIPRGIDGSTVWQLGSVLCTAYASVGIGFAISALARSTMQAVMIVPLVLIPQILFSGLVVETNQMSSPMVFALTNIMPSYAAQTMMDVGAFWNRKIVGAVYNSRQKAGDHLKDLLLREYLNNPPRPDMTKGDMRLEAARSFSIGKTYTRTDVGIVAAIKLLLWAVIGYVAAWFALRAKERG
jgi:ABC-type multidrug transport system ATPase subunit/pSer/pThr/pTyr-binding forkhead associated (FHA) protein